MRESGEPDLSIEIMEKAVESPESPPGRVRVYEDRRGLAAPLLVKPSSFALLEWKMTLNDENHGSGATPSSMPTPSAGRPAERSS